MTVSGKPSKSSRFDRWIVLPPDPSLPQAEVARRVRRERRLDKLLTFAWFVVMAIGVGMSIGRFHGSPLSLGLWAGIPTLVYIIGFVTFVHFRCPRCGYELQVSGRFTIGSLDRAKCEKCGVSFRSTPATEDKTSAR